MRGRLKRTVVVAAALGGLAALAGCDRGPASIPARDHADVAAGASAAPTAASAEASRPYSDKRYADQDQGEDMRTAPVPLVDGKPMWAANRRHSAEDNARYQFGRDGADFGAHDLDDFVSMAHAFVEHPPGDVETLTRANGDRLLYDPKANVFAVVTAEGAPRVMFKPRQGADYWVEQKQRIAEQDQGDGGQGSFHDTHRRRSGGEQGDDQG